MLPAGSRLHTSQEFAVVVRSGRRAGTRHLVVHLLHTGGTTAPRVGFVVSTKVGNAVVRHRVTRRLRPLMRAQLDRLPAGTEVVVRALPGAAVASSADLAADLRTGLAAAERKMRAAASKGSPATPLVSSGSRS
jgi:ribonuclease P protein component